MPPVASMKRKPARPAARTRQDPMQDHVVKSDDDRYEIAFHPAFASRCAVTHKDGSTKELYRQEGVYNLDGKGHPTQHVLRLTGKNGCTRDITITIDDPNHSIHSLRLELYDEGYDPMKPLAKYTGGDVVAFDNLATTCPPTCKT
jgi:hypothetical protein